VFNRPFALITVYWSLITASAFFSGLIRCDMVFADDRPQRALTVYPFAEYFQWEEKGLYVRESGMIYGLGAQGGRRLFDRGWWNAEVNGFIGEVDYDGTRFNAEPFRSKTFYLGVKAETDASYDLLPPGAARLEPFLGGGARWWKRRLDNTDEQLYGYDENWLSLYGRAGLRASWQATANWSFFAEVSALLPMYNHETVYLRTSQDSSNFSVNPGREWSPAVDLGADWKDYRWALYYEKLNFGASDVDESGYYQPESTADIIGLKLGVSL